MLARIRREADECREGARILASRDFWRAFRAYWDPSAVAARMDAWTQAHRRCPECGAPVGPYRDALDSNITGICERGHFVERP